MLAHPASHLASQFLSICIRAVDYCPPVDLRFGEYLRALITADRDLVPDDPWHYREALITAFRRRRIYPPGVDYLSEDALLWRGLPRRLAAERALSFAELRFEGEPGRAVALTEVLRQACALGRLVTRREHLDLFGLATPGDHPLGEVDLPCVESIRTSRRVGPDGQVVF